MLRGLMRPLWPDTEALGRDTSEPLLDEPAFLSLLRLERKRAGRSGQRFVLMLLELGPTLAHSSDGQAFDRFLSELVPSIRETDYKGWYEQGATLGVIFTDIGDASYGVVLEALLQRVGRALTAAFDADRIGSIRLSFNLFPEPVSNRGSGDGPDFLFYRDLVRDVAKGRTYQVLKRGLDIIASVSGLLLFCPVLLAIAIAIKLSSAGPVLFRQQRIGQYFRPFTFFKFRSMYVNCDDAIHKEYTARFISGNSNGVGAKASDGAVFKITKDPRVTAVGRFLRKTSLDELPQLLNVLRGDMTLVGPRPCVGYELERYAVWHRQRLLDVKPGITGLWQVTGRSLVGFDEMVRLDLAYVRARSFWLDLKILLQTPRAVISGVGAY